MAALQRLVSRAPALRASGALARLEEQGVKGVVQCGVDNILCHVADPTFVGYCTSRGADCASKTVGKSHAHEPVGVVATVNGALLLFCR